jgi:mRNA-degrading endonuclease RelE of RelBE toxin-antitoxin system
LIEYAGINISFDGVQLIVDPINLKRLSKSDAINVQRALNAEKEMREKVKSKMNSLPKKKVEKISDHILKLGDRVYLKNTHDLKIGKRVALRYRDENKQIEKESDSLSEKDMLLLKSAQSTELEILGVDNETGNYYVGAVIGNQGITFSVPKEFLIKSTKKR